MKWLIFLVLPTALHAEAVVSSRIIRAGTVISAEDLSTRPNSIVGAATSIHEISGLEARVMIYPDRPILYSQVGSPAIVQRNQIIPLVFLSGGLAIVTEGRALSRGGEGEVIRVQNLMSRVTVSGLIQTDGTVRVAGVGH